jgi:predicted transcriptional regulator YdeE
MPRLGQRTLVGQRWRISETQKETIKGIHTMWQEKIIDLRAAFEKADLKLRNTIADVKSKNTDILLLLKRLRKPVMRLKMLVLI